MKKKLPEKTVERLSLCRRILLNKLEENKQYIFSHEIAKLLNITPVQVRRDLMLLGYTGSPSKGYEIKKLVKYIGKKIDSKEGLNVAIVGMGNLGRALCKHLTNKREKLNIVASFDVDEKKISNNKSGVKCYHIDNLPKIAKLLNISIGILTVSSEAAPEVTEILIKGGIKGILNFTPTPLNVPDEVHLEEYDLITSLEKVAYFVKL